MVLPSQQRLDNRVPVITLCFDGKFTGLCKKYKCDACNGIVFGHYDGFISKFEWDIVSNPDKNFYKEFLPTDEIECKRRYPDDRGYINRCRTFYILCRKK